MKTDCFYVYDDQAVAVREVIPDGTVRIEFIQRTKPVKHAIVLQSALEEMTPQVIQRLRLKYNRMITQCNLRLHAIQECERYME